MGEHAQTVVEYSLIRCYCLYVLKMVMIDVLRPLLCTR